MEKKRKTPCICVLTVAKSVKSGQAGQKLNILLGSSLALYYFCTAKRAIVPWCNGSTSDFGSLSPRSNRSGTTVKTRKCKRPASLLGGICFWKKCRVRRDDES